MNVLTKNIIANYLGKLWGFISIFIFVRFYIELLGIESYAIINFSTVILGLLVFADAGLTATLTRELSRDISEEIKVKLVFTFERIYIVICLLIILAVAFSASTIANNFLISDNYSSSEVAYYLRIIGIGVALQLFSTLYEGGLNGLQHQVLTNKIRVIWSIFRSGIVLIPLWFIPKLEVYFWWQVACNIVLLLVLRNRLYSRLPSSNKYFSFEILKSTSSYALAMMGIAFISAINIQIDKLVTSKYLTLELFGHYSIASTLAQLPIMIVSPIIVAVFPVFSMFVSQQDTSAATDSFHKYSFLITIIAAPVALCIALYSVPLVTLWTGKPEIAQTTEYVVKLLLLGGLFLCMQLTPFYLALANGFTKINLYSGIVGLIVIIPLMIYSISHYGMIGATIPWVIVNIATFFIVGIYIVNRFLVNQTKTWLIWDIFFPLLITILIGIVIEICLQSIDFKYIFILKSILIGIISCIINLLIYNKKHPDNVLINLNALLKAVKNRKII